MSLHPWSEGPFELILHGELHYRAGDDFDRRMALISFDNAIEVSVSTYLSLNPIQRQNRSYARPEVERWLANFHSKLDFIVCECDTRNIEIRIEKSYLVWFHDQRNEQYHGGSPSIPNLRALRGIREAALWVFSVLYDVPNVEEVLETRVAQLLTPEDKPSRQDDLDRILDNTYGLVELAGGLYYTSELLHGYDPVAYRESGLELLNGRDDPEGIG